jgi:hypothetical protein
MVARHQGKATPTDFQTGVALASLAVGNGAGIGVPRFRRGFASNDFDTRRGSFQWT